MHIRHEMEIYDTILSELRNSANVSNYFASSSSIFNLVRYLCHKIFHFSSVFHPCFVLSFILEKKTKNERTGIAIRPKWILLNATFICVKRIFFPFHFPTLSKAIWFRDWRLVCIHGLSHISNRLKRPPNGFSLWNYKYNNFFASAPTASAYFFFYFFFLFLNEKILKLTEKVNDLLIVYSTDAKKKWMEKQRPIQSHNVTKCEKKHTIIIWRKINHFIFHAKTQYVCLTR